MPPVILVGFLMFSDVADEACWTQLLTQAKQSQVAGDRLQAQQFIERALTVATSFGENDPRLARTRATMAVFDMERGKYHSAEQLLRSALAATEAAAGFKMDAATYLHNLTVVLHHQGRYGEAVTHARESLLLAEQIFGIEHPGIVPRLKVLADILQELGRYEDAEAALLRAVTIQRQISGGDAVALASLLQRIGGLRLLHADYDAADRSMREALALLTKAGLPNRPETVRVHQSLALLQQARHEYRTAEVNWRAALKAADAVWGREHPETAKILLDYGELERIQHHADAETLLTEALQICERQLPGNHPQLATALTHVARLDVDQLRFSEAEALYRRSLTILESTVGPAHALVATVLSNLAGLLLRIGKEYEAEQSYRRAIDINERMLGPNHPRVAADLIAYAKFLRTKNRGEATRLEKRAKNIVKLHPQSIASTNTVAVEDLRK